jgi:hypothetical protein
MRLDPERAETLARLVCRSLRREYPNQIAHLLRTENDVRPPHELTPMFYGCYDWHSAVHSHWALVRLLRLFPGARWEDEVRAGLSESFTAERAGGELAYLADRPSFEVPYGMAWALQLDAELREAGEAMSAWQTVIAPLASLAGRRVFGWLQTLHYPIRTGEHSQSAFAMGLALDWARTAGNAQLADLTAEQARLSPALAEADLMRRVLGSAELEIWLAGFLPSEAKWEPVTPVDRKHGKLVHFDGLNLSRAWMMRGLAMALPEGHPRRRDLLAASALHEVSGMDGVDGRHYAGSHWLGSFAVYLLTDRGR